MAPHTPKENGCLVAENGKPPPMATSPNPALDIAVCSGLTVLTWAIKNGATRTVNGILADGASPNQRDELGTVPFAYDMELGQYDIARQLLDSGAEVDTLVHLGPSNPSADAMSRRLSVIRRLADNGVKLDELDSVSSSKPILQAVEQDDTALAGVLIDRGASVNTKNDDTFTLLQIAIIRRSEGMVTVLVKKGANPSITNRYGQTAWSIARERKLASILRILCGKGVDT